MSHLSDPWWFHYQAPDKFILATTDYFSKWVEAIPLREVKTSDVIKFLKHHVVYHFGVPWRIVHDSRPQFVSQSFQRFCNKFRIQSVSSTAYYPLPMVSWKHSIRPLKNFSRNSSWKVNVIKTRSLANVYGLTVQRWGLRWSLRHLPWCTGVKPYFL